MKTFGLYVVGHKGRIVLEGLTATPAFVVTYLDKGTDPADHAIIESICRGRDIPVYQRNDPLIPSVEVDLLVFVGWQYLIHGDMEKCVVFHDAYLPEMKGFAPTPTALILGRDLGVTAFQPTNIVDTGPIYIRRRITVTKQPMRLAAANEIIARNYTEMLEEILASDIKPIWPDGEEESFSIWRGPEDMIINWEYTSTCIERIVYALGPPLSGAKTMYRGKEIVLTEVQTCADMNFVERHYGKIWSITNNCPKVICGLGMLLINEAVDQDGYLVKFNRLRVRLGV